MKVDNIFYPERYVYLKLPALGLKTKLTIDGFGVHLRNVIETLELKHVTVEDLREVLNKLNPSMAYYGLTKNVY